MIKKQTDKGDILKKSQAKILKEFKHLKTTKYIQSDFVIAQADEICGYLNRLLIAPFQAWETFLLKSIDNDKEDFLYKFYLCENEFGIIVPDEERINELRLQDLATKS